jgi:hypothetical protein
MPPIPRRIPAPPAERDILADIRLVLGQEPDLVLWRLSQGAGIIVQPAQIREMTEALGAGKVERVIRLLEALDRFGRVGLVPGAADLIGILRTSTRTVRRGTCVDCPRDAHGRAPQPALCINVYRHDHEYLLHDLGRFFSLEVKRPPLPGRRGGRASDEQLQWGALVRSMGGFYAVVDSVDSARAALLRARSGGVE